MTKLPTVQRTWSRRFAAPVRNALFALAVPLGIAAGAWIWLSDARDPLIATGAVIVGTLVTMTTASAAVTAWAHLPRGPMQEIRSGFGCKSDEELAYLFRIGRKDPKQEMQRLERDGFTDAEAKTISEVWAVAKLVNELIPGDFDEDFKRRADFVKRFDSVLGRSIRESVQLGYGKKAARLLDYRITSINLRDVG